jgi:hypothetical protein
MEIFWYIRIRKQKQAGKLNSFFKKKWLFFEILIQFLAKFSTYYSSFSQPLYHSRQVSEPCQTDRTHA